MTQPAPGLKATPLNAAHRKLGAKMVDFGGWDMPVQYSGIIEEHHAVRKAVGLFDVSHMGEIEIRGPEAFAADGLRHHQRCREIEDRAGAVFRAAVRTRRIRRRHPGPQSRGRSLLPLRQRVQSGQGFRAHRRRRIASNAKVEFASDRYAQIAIQGPKALGDFAKAHRHRSRGHPVLSLHRRRGFRHSGAHRSHRLHRRRRLRDLHRARTGRANLERDSGRRQRIRHQTVRSGRAQHAAAGIQDGALRPRDPRLHHAVRSGSRRGSSSWTRAISSGSAALSKQKEQGVTRKLVGFEMTGRGIGRDGYEVYLDGVAGRLGHQRRPVAHARTRTSDCATFPPIARSLASQSRS